MAKMTSDSIKPALAGTTKTVMGMVPVPAAEFMPQKQAKAKSNIAQAVAHLKDCN